MKALSAKKRFSVFTPSEEDKLRLVTIEARGYISKTGIGCGSITRVVLLSDRNGGIVKEAYSTHATSMTRENGFGATNSCQSLTATFWPKDVKEVMAAAPDGEYLVAVFSGPNHSKIYKVKKKFQDKLVD